MGEINKDIPIIHQGFNVRYDTYDQWMSHDPILYNGTLALATDIPKEVIISEFNKHGYHITEDDLKDKDISLNLVKIGNGKNHYSELEFFEFNNSWFKFMESLKK